jgi:hypothetical protein
MARGGRSDERTPGISQTPERQPPRPSTVDPARHARSGPARDGLYRPNESEVRTLATVGSFRIVPVRDLDASRGHPGGAANTRRLIQAGLLERQTLTIAGRSTPVVALTKKGKEALERGLERDLNPDSQRFHAGFVKPREASHDAQLHAVYKAEAARIEKDGGRPVRVVLDYELKRDYQAYLHRKERPASETLEEARDAFAASRQLPVVDGHLELPDLRIEYETADGCREVRDLELLTEHYSRAQIAGKAEAGFVAYRSGSGSRSGNARTGGTPYDPHYLDWVS